MLNEQFPWVDMMEFYKRTAFSLVVTAGKATFVCHNHIIENRRFGLKYVHNSLFWLYLLVLPHNAIFQPMEKKKLLFFIGSPVLGRYINGNHSVTLWADGSKHRATGHWEDKKKQFPFFKRMKATILEAFHRKPTEYAWVKDDQDHLYFDFPENFDIKITDQCDGGCAYCFPEGTPVRLPNGTQKAIEAITEGDKVLSYDVTANKCVIGMVSRLFKREYNGELIGIELNGVTTWCTPNHKILTKNRGLVQASDITSTDDIITV